MAKELPYFKFRIEKWLTGNVTLLDMQTQGVFINACVLFWSRDCVLTFEDLFERFKKKDRKCLEKLIEKKIICVENKNISIKFLEKQQESFEILGETNKKNVKKRYESQQNQPSNSTTEKVVVYNIDKRREDKSREEEIREDNNITPTANLKFHFRLKEVVHYQKISEYFDLNYQIFLTQFRMKNGHEIVDQIYNQWDIEKNGYSYNSENHIQNMFNGYHKKIINENAKPNNQNSRRSDLDKLTSLTGEVLRQPFTLIDNNPSPS